MPKRRTKPALPPEKHKLQRQCSNEPKPAESQSQQADLCEKSSLVEEPDEQKLRKNKPRVRPMCVVDKKQEPCQDKCALEKESKQQQKICENKKPFSTSMSTKKQQQQNQSSTQRKQQTLEDKPTFVPFNRLPKKRSISQERHTLEATCKERKLPKLDSSVAPSQLVSLAAGEVSNPSFIATTEVKDGESIFNSMETTLASIKHEQTNADESQLEPVSNFEEDSLIPHPDGIGNPPTTVKQELGHKFEDDSVGVPAFERRPLKGKSELRKAGDSVQVDSTAQLLPQVSRVVTKDTYVRLTKHSPKVCGSSTLQTINTNNLVCPFCNECFILPKVYKKHLDQHRLVSCKICDMCEMQFKTKTALLVHMKTHSLEDGNGKQILAGVSSDSFPRTSRNSQFTCNVGLCKESLKTRQKLVAHLKTHHNTCVQRFLCGYCNSKWNRMAVLKKHMTKNHPSLTLVKCGMCYRSYNTYSKLESHVASHSTQRAKSVSSDKQEKKKTDLAKSSSEHLDDARKSARKMSSSRKEFKPKSKVVCRVNTAQCVARVKSKTVTSVKSSKSALRGKQSNCKTSLPTPSNTRLRDTRNTPRGVSRCAQDVERKSKRQVPRFECGICGKLFNTKRLIANHVRTHLKSKVDKFICDVPLCKKEFNTKEKLRMHNYRHLGKTYNLYCSVYPCKKRFKSQEERFSHILMMHADDNGWVYHCNVPMCGKGFTSLKYMRNHSKMLHSNDKFACAVPGCPRQYYLKQDLDRHMKNHGTFVCKLPTCNKPFITKHKLHYHMMMHRMEENKVFRCNEPLCGNSFGSKITLNHHMKTHAKIQDRPFKCDLCIKRYRQKQGLEIHMSVHNSILHCAEPTCDHTFTDEPSLRRHLKTHPHLGKKCTCNVCGKQYKDRHSLTTHISLLNHVFRCNEPTCDHTFTDEPSLKRHFRTHLNPDQHFTCNACNKQFTQKHHLRIHILDKHVFPCKEPKCNHSFTDKPSLKRHSRTHSNHGLPFTCNVCNKQYKQKVSLTTHMKHHSGIEAFVCGICGKRFQSKSGTSVHMKNSHGSSGKLYCDNAECNKKFACHLKERKDIDVEGSVVTVLSLTQCSITRKTLLSKTRSVNVAQSSPSDEDMSTLYSDLPTQDWQDDDHFGAQGGEFARVINGEVGVMDEDDCLVNAKTGEVVEKRTHVVNAKTGEMVNESTHVISEKKGKILPTDNKERVFFKDMKEMLDAQITLLHSNHCSVCNKRFLTKQHLAAHRALHSLTCNVCDKSFKTKEKLDAHIALHSLTCSVCNKPFKTKEKLDAHVALHSLTCSVCDKSFKTKEKLHAHKALHSLTCSVCDKPFKTKEKLDAHVALHFNNVSWKQKAQEPRYAVNKNNYYNKPICGKFFVNEHSLRSHLLTHPELSFDASSGFIVQPFMCGICGDQFKKQHNIYYHIQTYHASESLGIFDCPSLQCNKLYMGHLKWRKGIYVDGSVMLALCVAVCEGLESTEKWVCVLPSEEETPFVHATSKRRVQGITQKKASDEIEAGYHEGGEFYEGILSGAENDSSVLSIDEKETTKESLDPWFIQDDVLGKVDIQTGVSGDGEDHEGRMDKVEIERVVREANIQESELGEAETQKGGSHMCPVCQKQYWIKSSLKSHILNVHKYHQSGVDGVSLPPFDVFECSQCSKRYFSRRGLDSHYSRLHGQDSDCSYAYVLHVARPCVI